MTKKKLTSILSFNNIGTIFAFITCFYLIINYSKSISSGIKTGLLICANIIIPSLFIFMVFTSYFQKSGGIFLVSKILSPFTKYVLHIDKSLGGVILLSLIGGYPVGGKLISSLVEENKIDLKTAEKMLPFCVNAGPSFLITAVGVSMYKSLTFGIYLYTTQILASLLLLSIFCRNTKNKSYGKEQNCNVNFAQCFTSSVSQSVTTLIGLCGYIVFFSALTSFLKDNNFIYNFLNNIHLSNSLSKVISDILIGLLEVTGGIVNFATYPQNCVSIILFLISFSGISVIFQVLSFFKEYKVSAGKFIMMKVVHGAFTVLVGKILYPIFMANIKVEGIYNILSYQKDNNKYIILFILSCIILLIFCKIPNFNKK